MTLQCINVLVLLQCYCVHMNHKLFWTLAPYTKYV